MELTIILLVVAGLCIWFGLRVRRFIRRVSAPPEEGQTLCDGCPGCTEESCGEREKTR